ncbi:MAG: hypothetical protein WC263_02195 [Candidatus Micrarchaeia archaeon]|jgi:hypothetical protein
MEHAKPPHKDSSMPKWEGSRGGYRGSRAKRNGRYGDACPASNYFSRAHQGEKPKPE